MGYASKREDEATRFETGREQMKTDAATATARQGVTHGTTCARPDTVKPLWETVGDEEREGRRTVYFEERLKLSLFAWDGPQSNTVECRRDHKAELGSRVKAWRKTALEYLQSLPPGVEEWHTTKSDYDTIEQYL